MGGRGAGSGASGGGNTLQVKSVVVQSGNTVDLSAFPLTYGKPDSAISGNARAAVEAFEQSHLKSKTEYGVLLDANGNQVYTAHGGRGSVGMPHFMYQQSAIMSHNHPRGKGSENSLGGTFSSGDLSVFSRTAVTTMRASAAEGTYSITKGPGFDKTKFAAFATKTQSIRQSKYRSKIKALGKEYQQGNITYGQYSARADREFNHMLVGLHNDLLAGQKQYGYTYTLERRSP